MRCYANYNVIVIYLSSPIFIYPSLSHSVYWDNHFANWKKLVYSEIEDIADYVDGSKQAMHMVIHKKKKKKKSSAFHAYVIS